MKKILITLSLGMLTMFGVSQSNYTAIIPGGDTELKGYVESGTLKFEISPVTDAKQIDLMNNKAAPYKKEISLEIKAGENTAVVLVTLDDKGKDMKWLYRFFLNAGIGQVNFDGKTLSAADFFKPWM